MLNFKFYKMKKLLFPLICFGFLFVACNDDDDNDQSKIRTAKEYISENRENAKQEIAFNTSDLPKTFTLKNGVEITIKEGTFTKDGKPVTGAITLEVYEMLKPSSIIFSGTNTNYTGNRYLITDGFIYVNATQNGVSLDEYLSKNLLVAIPTAKADGETTQLWLGTEEAGKGEDQFAWEDFNEEAINWNDEGEWNGQEYNTVWAKEGVFQFSFGKLGWCNCDVLWEPNSEWTTVTVELTGNVGKLASYLGYQGDTFVFFCGKGFPIVAQLYTEVSENTVKSYDNSMPIGAEGKLIAFSIQDGKFSFASKDIKITENMQVTLELKEVTKQHLDDQIKSIDGYSK